VIRAYPNRYVVCEATAKPQDYGSSKICGGAFAFGYVHNFIEAATGGKDGTGKRDAVRKLATYYRTASPNMATFLSNHDSFAGDRVWDQVRGDATLYKLAAAGYLLQPGTPYIYYGEEIGQGGVTELKGDFPIRSPMSWTADNKTNGFTTGAPFRPFAPNIANNNVDAQRADPNSIFNFYKSMIALRNTRASIARGNFVNSFFEGEVLGYERQLGAERTLVIINYGTAAASVSMRGMKKTAKLSALFPTAASSFGNAEKINIAPQSVLVLDVK
jgi:alpha-amylase